MFITPRALHATLYLFPCTPLFRSTGVLVGTANISLTSSLTVTGSGTITVIPGAATKLAIATQPSTSAQSGTAFATQPVDRKSTPLNSSHTVISYADVSSNKTTPGT